MKKLSPPMKAVIAATSLILILIIVFWVNKYFESLGRSYAISYGIILGLFCGYLLQTNKSKNIKIGTVGIFSGMGLDLFANSLDQNKTEPAVNAINSVGSFVSSNAANIFTVDPGSIGYMEKSITLGLWIFALVIALVLIFASFFTPTAEP